MTAEAATASHPKAAGPGVPPARLPVLPLAHVVVFPHVVLPLAVTGVRQIATVDRVVESHKRLVLGVVRLPADSQDVPAGVVDGVDRRMLYEFGTLGTVVRLLKLGDGSIRMLVQGLERVRITDIEVGAEDGLSGEYSVLESVVREDLKTEALKRSVTETMQRVIQISPSLTDELEEMLLGISDPGKLADFVAANLTLSVEAKVELLATADVTRRLERLSGLLAQEIQVLEVGSQIQEKLRDRLDEHQRQYVLREQLKVIQEELGDGEAPSGEIGDLLAKLERANLPEEAFKAARRELDRLKRMAPQSAEYQVACTYVETLAALPWGARSEDRLDVVHARQVLDRDHYDLEAVKDRIVEYLAVRRLNPEAHGSILCFVGPPGVGKTSLGQSIAEALGRAFLRMSLGGMRDEAEIRGHRRTYVGALPGRILQLLSRAGKRNPVFMLDEVDKLGADFRGDPTAALLEVLDPAQNHAFVDHYVEVPFDLSEVMFIATANTLAPVPPALADRLEVLSLVGYTPGEKLEIARRYLVPRQVRETGLSERGVSFTAGALRRIVSEYTREAGVRQLEREIQHVLRKLAVRVVRGEEVAQRQIARAVVAMLGQPRVQPEVAGRSPEVGVSTGLVWTPVGGDIVFIEALKMPGRGQITLTGQLGDVMKESAQAAWSLIRSRGATLGAGPEAFAGFDTHLHVPAGAVPKDGPSAGVSIAAALASLYSGRPVRPELAATGELTLRGRVLPVGGIKEKLIAAERAGIKTVLVPARNSADVEEVPQEVRRSLDIRYVNTVDEVLDAALLPAAGTARARPAVQRPPRRPRPALADVAARREGASRR